MSYLSAGAGSLLVDTLSLSKSAMSSAIARLGRLRPPLKASLVSGEKTTACRHGNLAPSQSDSLVKGDGFVVPGDAYLLFGGTPMDELTADTANRTSWGEESVHNSKGVGSAGAADVHIELNSTDSPRTIQAQMEQPAFAATSVAKSDAPDSGGQLSTELVASVISDKQLGLLNSDNTSASKQFLHAAAAGKPAEELHNMVTSASEQVTKIGMAAIAVNEAEASVAAVPGTEEQLLLVSRLDVSAEVIDDAIGAVAREAGKEATLAPEGRLSQSLAHSNRCNRELVCTLV